MAKPFWVAASLVLALAACNEQVTQTAKHLSPIPPATLALMSQKGMSKNDPILVRAYKKEAEMEVWKRASDGRYAHLKTYPICRWSGQLGPKVREGDRQAPEGFYTVTPAQMNPNSAYYLSFDTGYPNAYDRAHGRTGSALMVHGTCSSRGCFAMTDEAIAEVFAVAREAFAGGQRGFQFQSYPFRMTAENLAKHRADEHIGFWKNLKEGSDHFEVTRSEPRVSVSGGRYAFNADDPSTAAAVAQKQAEDERKVAELVGKGVAAVKVVYEDGSQHASFRGSGGGFAMFSTGPSRNLGEVSRPEALAMGPREIPIEEGKTDEKRSTALAFAPAKASPAGAKPSVAASRTAPPAPDSVAAASTTASSQPALTPGLGGSKPGEQRMLGNPFNGPAASEVDTAQAEPRTEARAKPAPRRN